MSKTFRNPDNDTAEKTVAFDSNSIKQPKCSSNSSDKNGGSVSDGIDVKVNNLIWLNDDFFLLLSLSFLCSVFSAAVYFFSIEKLKFQSIYA